MSKAIPRGFELPTQSTISSKSILFSTTSDLVNKIYNHLISGFKGNATGLKAVWEKEWGIAYEEEEWSGLTEEMLRPMRDARSKLIQFKIFNRLYWTPVRMNRLGLNLSKLCWRCKTDKGDLLHIFLHCPSLTAYWQRVTEKIIDTLGTNITLTPALCFLNV